MRALLPGPLKLEMSSLARLGHAAMVVAQAEGYQTVTVWEVIAADGQPLPAHAGLKAGMAFAEPVIERFFAERENRLSRQ